MLEGRVLTRCLVCAKGRLLTAAHVVVSSLGPISRRLARNAKRQSPLHMAAHAGAEDVVDFLLEVGGVDLVEAPHTAAGASTPGLVCDPRANQLGTLSVGVGPPWCPPCSSCSGPYMARSHRFARL